MHPQKNRCITFLGGWKYSPKSSNYCTPRHIPKTPRDRLLQMRSESENINCAQTHRRGWKEMPINLEIVNGWKGFKYYARYHEFPVSVYVWVNSQSIIKTPKRTQDWTAQCSFCFVSGNWKQCLEKLPHAGCS